MPHAPRGPAVSPAAYRDTALQTGGQFDGFSHMRGTRGLDNGPRNPARVSPTVEDSAPHGLVEGGLVRGVSRQDMRGPPPDVHLDALRPLVFFDHGSKLSRF